MSATQFSLTIFFQPQYPDLGRVFTAFDYIIFVRVFIPSFISVDYVSYRFPSREKKVYLAVLTSRGHAILIPNNLLVPSTLANPRSIRGFVCVCVFFFVLRGNSYPGVYAFLLLFVT